MRIYLAGPYSHEHEHIRLERFAKLNKAAAKLMNKGHVVFSPVSHSHTIARHLKPELLMDHDFWMNQDLPFLEDSDEMVVLMLDGWDKSRGVNQEIETAEQLGIPVRYATLSDLD